MKRKWGEYEINLNSWMILLCVFAISLITAAIITIADNPEPANEPAIVQHQHEIVLRVVTEQVSASADEDDFCSAEDCWWKFPASIVFMLVGVLGGLILIIDKVSRD